MFDNGTKLYCSKCNKKTVHRRLSASEVKDQNARMNHPKYKILRFVFSVLLNQNNSKSNVSYFKCTICGSEYNENESIPNGWG
jgi:ribosomal protein L44E